MKVHNEAILEYFWARKIIVLSYSKIQLVSLMLPKHRICQGER